MASPSSRDRWESSTRCAGSEAEREVAGAFTRGVTTTAFVMTLVVVLICYAIFTRDDPPFELIVVLAVLHGTLRAALLTETYAELRGSREQLRPRDIDRVFG